MLYKNGLALEQAVFGVHSSGNHLVQRFKEGEADFGTDLKAVIEELGLEYPNTHIGRSLYSMVKRELELFGIDTAGFVFRSAIDTKVDLRHFSDGIFYLPSIPMFPVTIDVFNISSRDLIFLRDSWIDSFDGQFYSDWQCQSDLFQHKIGTSEWRKFNQESMQEGISLVRPTDFRHYASSGRPENHFIVTPYHLGSYQRRRAFAKMVARYFAKVSSHEMFEQNH